MVLKSGFRILLSYWNNWNNWNNWNVRTRCWFIFSSTRHCIALQCWAAALMTSPCRQGRESVRCITMAWRVELPLLQWAVVIMHQALRGHGSLASSSGCSSSTNVASWVLPRSSTESVPL